MTNKHPSKEECLALLNEYDTPEHVVRHCSKVTDTALKIGEALNNAGCDLNLDLIQSAGLIHDIARVHDKHWEVGAQIAANRGYVQEADIIMRHMNHTCDSAKDRIDEIDIICLSDRMVKEDEFVGLETRMQYVLDKFKDDQKRWDMISARISDNRRMIKRIEKIIGTSIDSIV